MYGWLISNVDILTVGNMDVDKKCSTMFCRKDENFSSDWAVHRYLYLFQGQNLMVSTYIEMANLECFEVQIMKSVCNQEPILRS
jgi:hypothetical protein